MARRSTGIDRSVTRARFSAAAARLPPLYLAFFGSRTNRTRRLRTALPSALRRSRIEDPFEYDGALGGYGCPLIELRAHGYVSLSASVFGSRRLRASVCEPVNT